MNVVHYDAHQSSDSAGAVSTRYCFDWIMRLGVVAAILLGFFYVMLLNSLATQGFALEEMKAERLSIQRQVEKWDISLAIPISLYALQSSEQVQQMQDVTKKDYLAVEEGQVAMNQ